MWNRIAKMYHLSRAKAHNRRGRRLHGLGRFAEAKAAYLRADQAAPWWSVSTYNLGFLHKVRGEWEESLYWNQVTVERHSNYSEAWWNLGIAATALGRWTEARRAWRGFGVDLPDGEGPIDFPLGLCPIRLNPESVGEVIWCLRVDPARAVITGGPLPESGFRFSDLLLNDGAPTGYRLLDGQEVPVLDCLQLLEPSRFSTFIAEIEISDEDPSLARLEDLASSRGCAIEDWTAGTLILCAQCSQGRPHEHEHHHTATSGKARQVGIAALTLEKSEGLLRDWSAGTEGVRVVSLELGLEA